MPFDSACDTPNSSTTQTFNGEAQSPKTKGKGFYQIEMLPPERIGEFVALQEAAHAAMGKEEKHHLKPITEQQLVHLMAQRSPVLVAVHYDKKETEYNPHPHKDPEPGTLVGGVICVRPTPEVMDQLPGYEFGGFQDTTMVLRSLFVDRNHEGNGLSSRLIAASQTVAAMSGHTVLMAKVAQSNGGSSHVFCKQGFNIVSTGASPMPDQQPGQPATYPVNYVACAL